MKTSEQTCGKCKRRFRSPGQPGTFSAVRVRCLKCKRSASSSGRGCKVAKDAKPGETLREYLDRVDLEKAWNIQGAR